MCVRRRLEKLCEILHSGCRNWEEASLFIHVTYCEAEIYLVKLYVVIAALVVSE